MSRNQRWLAAISLLAAAAPIPVTYAAAPASGPVYSQEPAIPLPDGRWDLASFDAEHQAVLVARGDSVSVVDVASSAVRSLGKVARGHAALAIPGTNLIAVTTGQDDALLVLDRNDGHETARIPVGKNPDAALWDSASRHIIVMNAKGGTVSVVDPRTATVVRTIQVKPGLELAAMVGPNLLAINDEDANELELVDLAGGKALRPIALTGCNGPTGLAYDPVARLAMSSCANGQAALVDMRSKRLVLLLPIGLGPDTVMFDRHRSRFLIPCGRSGTLSVFAVDRHGAVISEGAVQTEPSARTGAIDPASGHVYLPSARFLPAEAGKRPELVPGSVHLMVLSAN